MNITKYTGDDFPDMYFNLSTKLAKVTNHISPRYIASSSCEKDLFYQRSVYVNNEGFATRFISLSSMANPKSKTSFKDKHVHALSIKPLIHLSKEELIEPQISSLGLPNTEEAQMKLPPGMRNPFLDPNSAKTSNALLQAQLIKEKLELGQKLIRERKIKANDGNNSDDSEEVAQDGRSICLTE